MINTVTNTKQLSNIQPKFITTKHASWTEQAANWGDLIVAEIQPQKTWSFSTKSKEWFQSTQAIAAQVQWLQLQQVSASFSITMFLLAHLYYPSQLSLLPSMGR